MKRFSIFFFAIVFLISACDKGDDSPLTADTIHYDGDNFSAPLLAAGSYEAGAKFTFSKLQRFQGGQLTEVNMYIQSIPTNVEVKIYGEGNESEPGPLLYNEDWNGLTADSWNDHVLSNPVDITGSEMWVIVKYDHPSDMRSIGCDRGPADANGDWMFDYSKGIWETLRSFSSDAVDINWNIRAQGTEN